MTNIIAVDETYRHVAKIASPGPLLTVGSSRLKWYDIGRADTPVAPFVRNTARAYLAREQASLELDRDLGFVFLHRCGADQSFHFLGVCTWRNANELWESVYYKDAEMADFAPFPQAGRHRGAFCVWELGPVIYERKAWTRFLTSPRDERDVSEYLQSMFEGAV
jgi:hypothetical protein